jgi:hypothetical protein
MGKTILFSMACFSFAAFGADKVYDTLYYSAHIKEAKKVVAECAAGDISGENCTNAARAIDKKKAQDVLDKYKNK